MNTQTALFSPVSVETAPEKSRPLLENVQKSFKFIPNLFGVFAIYDTYDDEAGRQAHLNGEAGQEFTAAVKAGELFAEAPKIYFLQVVAEK